MTPLSDLEVMRLSAKACGYQVVTLNVPKEHVWIEVAADGLLNRWRRTICWNPFTNDSQRWECIEKLIDLGYMVRLDSSECAIVPRNNIRIDCPAEEFPARALAELERRDDKVA